MDYRKKSDFEINILVSAYLWGSSCSVDGVVLHGEKDGEFNPCNNPADAWSIIVDNQISIINLSEEEWGATGRIKSGVIRTISDNPLRAAMIIFLMMQDNK